MNNHPVLRRNWTYLLVLVIYVGIAVGMTWPLAIKSTTHLLAGSWDTLFHYWNGWWVRQALTTGQSPFYSQYLFYPTGVSLVYNNFAWLNIAAWGALEPWIGGLAAYNLPLLFSLALCGFTAFALTHYLTGNGIAAFLAGMIYLCWPFRLSQLGHPNLISTQWIPLFLLFLIRTLRNGRWQDGVLTGVFLALTGYTRWQQLIAVPIVGGIYLIWTLWNGWISQRRQMRALLLASVVACIALAPPVLLLVNQQLTAPADLVVEEEEVTKQTDLLAYLTPSTSHPVMGSLAQTAYRRYYADRSSGSGYSAYLGAITLLLAFLAIWRARQAALPWVAMALVLLLLALGPVLRINGHLYPAVPMPYQLVARLFLVRLLRFPDRLNMFLALPVAVLAGYGAASLLSRVRQYGIWIVTAVSSLLGAAILFDYLVIPVPLERPQVSPIYARLADEPGEFAVLNLPLDPQKSKLYMFAQTVHHHPILQGHTSRLPPGSHAYLDGHPWLRVLRQHSEMNPSLTDVSRQLASLAEDGIRYIILHKTQVGADRIAHWKRYLLARPRFEDEQIAVYITTPQAGQDFAMREELAHGIGIIDVITSTRCLNPGRVLEVDVGWGTSAPPRQALHVRVALVADENDVIQEEVFPLSPNWSTREWPTSAVAWGYYALRTPYSLASGIYTVTLALEDPVTGARQGRSVAVGQVVVKESVCEFDALPDTADVVPTVALFGDDLRLLGFQRQRDGQRLRLTLYWRSERRMETDYKIFVHVFDPATGVPVAQDDAMPHRWAYPTTFWGPGEVVDDLIPIPLAGIQPGAYGIAVGVYNPTTMERLPVMDGTGRPNALDLQPDGRFVLPGQAVIVEEREPGGE
jgi:hypothetical protein